MPNGNASTPMTVGDLLALLPPDIDPATPLWVDRYDPECGHDVSRPIEAVRLEYLHTAKADEPGTDTSVIVTLVVS